MTAADYSDLSKFNLMTTKLLPLGYTVFLVERGYIYTGTSGDYLEQTGNINQTQ